MQHEKTTLIKQPIERRRRRRKKSEKEKSNRFRNFAKINLLCITEWWLVDDGMPRVKFDIFGRADRGSREIEMRLKGRKGSVNTR